MGPPRILIIYASSYGQTARIARRIGEILQLRGHEVDLTDAGGAGPEVQPGLYDGVIVGSSLIARGHQPAATRFVERHASTLNRGISAFFQVSASAGSARAESRAAAQDLLDGFLHRMRWRPRLSASIAGAINYTRYNLLLRWYMKEAARRNGGSTDTSRDHEYTDWNQVERFAVELAELVEQNASLSIRSRTLMALTR